MPVENSLWDTEADCRKFEEFYCILSFLCVCVRFVDVKSQNHALDFSTFCVSVFVAFIERVGGAWEGQGAYSTGSYSTLRLFLLNFVVEKILNSFVLHFLSTVKFDLCNNCMIQCQCVMSIYN